MDQTKQDNKSSADNIFQLNQANIARNTLNVPKSKKSSNMDSDSQYSMDEDEYRASRTKSQPNAQMMKASS